jgi:polysaccharide deacetylase
LSDRTTILHSDHDSLQATVGIDLDPLDVHLAGYGMSSTQRDVSVYEVGVPRIVDLLERHDIRATFFVLGRDAPAQGGLLRWLVGQGHEIADHSMTHPAALARLRPDRLEVELVQSKRALEDAIGTEVVGFRSPNWDIDRRLIARLAEAGFAYDASTIPSPLLPLLRFAVAAKSRRPGSALRLQLAPLTSRPGPQVLSVGGRRIVEFPISVSTRTRLPIYHTMRPMISDAALDRHLDGLARRRLGIDYAVHGIDAMGLVEDGIDPRLGRHPGMHLALIDKLSLLDRTLAAIRDRFTVVPYRDRLDAGPTGSS